MTSAQDRTRRAMTDDGSFRCIACRASDTVVAAAAAQGVSGEDARTFGELLVAATLYRETMAPTLRVQLTARAEDGSLILGDARPEGYTRGLVQRRGERIDLSGGEALLKMQRELPGRRVHDGVVGIPEDGSLSNAMVAYFDQSEQILSMVSVGVALDERGAPLEAGGFVLQILPEAKDARGPHMVLAERVTEYVDLAPTLLQTHASPDALIEELFHGMDFTWLDESPLRFDCDCSRERMLAGLATLDPDELRSLADDGAPIETDCHFCGKAQSFSPDELRALIAP